MAIYSGETINHAIEKGLKDLGIDRKHAKIAIIQQPKPGILGFFSKEAKVEIIKLSNADLEKKKKFRKFAIIGSVAFFLILLLGSFIEAKSINQQKALAEVKAEAESIAEVKHRKEENAKRTENIIKKGPLHDKYVDQFLESYDSDSGGWHIEVINKIYPYLEYIEIGDRVQLIFTPEADAQLTDRDLEKIWGDELVGFYDDVYDNVITEDLHEHEDHYDYDDYDDYDDSDADDGNNSPGYHTVEGYTRTNSDGSSTHVDGYIRSNPDGDLSNNLSPPY